MNDDTVLDIENRTIEEWRDAPGFEESYQVSSLGRLKRKAFSMIYSNGQHHSYPDYVYDLHCVAPMGYFVVRLKDCKGKYQSRYLHRLVAEAFLDKPNGCNVVNHIDGDKTNNRLDNLEWCTSSRNSIHAINMYGKMGAIEIRPVRCIELDKDFCSSAEASRWVKDEVDNNCNTKTVRGNIWLAANGNRPTAYGYHWRFI